MRANPRRSDDDPPDVSYRFDKRLREVPNDPAGMARAVAEIEARLAAGVSDPGERMRALGTLGGYRRILGRLDEAEATLREAVALARQTGNERTLLANEIRLAHVLQWQERFAEADALFVAAVARCKASPELTGLLSFALQHAGKSLFDQGRDAEAAERFAHALSLREAEGDPDLIASSRLALVAARARLTG
ncbi:MAG: tetratricopeptide repeat protein [Chloroflexota bacterium]|nr:tetratricopeptide repeat protein [Chloroflexota bacterium]